MTKNDTVKTQFQKDIADLVVRAKQIEDEIARRQAEPDESEEGTPLPHTSTLPDSVAEFFASQGREIRREQYRTMRPEIAALRDRVRETLLAAAPFLEVAKPALSSFDQITTLRGLTRLLAGLLESASIANNLRRAREAAGHTQEKAAEALKTDRSTFARWERGDCLPSVKNRRLVKKYIQAHLPDR